MFAGLTDFLTSAYLIMGFVALVAYAPQLLTFYKRPEVCAATPLVTWSLWACQTVVFFLYAVVVNGDPKFMTTTFLFMCATMACLALIVRGRKLHGMTMKASNVVILKAA
jgi:hypothetical protein